MEIKTLQGDKAVEFILKVLSEADKPLTTREVQKIIQEEKVRCPDSTAVFLYRLRNKGIIKGERNPKRRGWIWWKE
jgi:predicted transcriptional regulator